MAERLPLILHKPKVVLDWGAPASASDDVLSAACPQAKRLAILAQDAEAPVAAPWWSPRRWRGGGSPLEASSLTPAAGDLLWANMGLHWCADPLAEMQRWHEVLAVDGFLMFSTLGPGSLTALRNVYAEQAWPTPHAAFVDMHDLGDMLVRAGFAEPVMDQETLTLTWPDGGSLLAELRALGGNADPARHPGLRTPRWRDQLLRGLQPRPSERPALEFEIVYGHAFRPLPRPRLAAETTVGLQDMRSILRR
jgi:malonyl-CoA O-methyltransferase